MPTGRRAPTLDGATVRRFWVVVLATLCVLVAAQTGPWRPTQEVVDLPSVLQPTTPPIEQPVVESRADPSDLAPPPDDGPDLGWLRRAAVVAVVAVLLAALVRWALRRQLPVRPPPSDTPAARPPVAGPPPDPQPDLDVLREGARAAAEHLRGTASPADAVIAAWVALEEAAARSGVVREPSATATEFTLHVLDRTRADPVDVRTLLALYLRARFDDRPLLAADVQDAARSARALVDSVTRPARVAPDAPVAPVAPGAPGAPGAPVAVVTRPASPEDAAG